MQVPTRFHYQTLSLKDTLYKLYTVLHKTQLKAGDMSILDLVENAILFNAAPILQIVYENRRGTVAGQDCTTIRCFLGVLLYHVLRRYFEPTNRKHNNSIPFTYRYHWSYVDLFCQCVRQNTITKTDGYVEISSTDVAILLPRKLFVKIIVALSNTVNMIVNNEEHIFLPREIGNLLRVHLTDIKLSEEQLNRLSNVLVDSIGSGKEDENRS